MRPRFPSAREQRPKDVSITSAEWVERVARKTLCDTESNTVMPQRIAHLRGIGSSVLDQDHADRIIRRVAEEEGIPWE